MNFDAEGHADLVVKRGRATKNRFGPTGKPVPLPDGAYEISSIGLVSVALTTSVPVVPGACVQITSVALPHAWRIDQLVVSGAWNWRLRSVTINGREQLKPKARRYVFVDSMLKNLRWKIRAGCPVTMILSYVGGRKRGEKLNAHLCGTRTSW